MIGLSRLTHFRTTSSLADGRNLDGDDGGLFYGPARQTSRMNSPGSALRLHPKQPSVATFS